MVATDDKLLVHATIRSDTKAKLSDSRIYEALKLLQHLFASEPAQFTAIGGTVQMAGQTVWIFVPCYYSTSCYSL